MKRQLPLAAVMLIAALPIAAQASVASRQALEANHQPLAPTTTQAPQGDAADDKAIEQFSGSAAMIDAQREIAAITAHRTNLSGKTLPMESEEPEVGHAVDW